MLSFHAPSFCLSNLKDAWLCFKWQKGSQRVVLYVQQRRASPGWWILTESRALGDDHPAGLLVPVPACTHTTISSSPAHKPFACSATLQHFLGARFCPQKCNRSHAIAVLAVIGSLFPDVMSLDVKGSYKDMAAFALNITYAAIDFLCYPSGSEKSLTILLSIFIINFFQVLIKTSALGAKFLLSPWQSSIHLHQFEALYSSKVFR